MLIWQLNESSVAIPGVEAVMTLYPEMTYYDIHTHQPSVRPEDIAIVNTIVEAGHSPESDEANNLEASLSPNYRSVGIHPWYINNVHVQLAELEMLVFQPGVVAIGEAGLDKLAEPPLNIQEEVFLAQIALSEETGKPLIIHCVKAWAEIIEIRKRLKPRLPWVIHGFRGNSDLARQLLRQGLYLSFGEHFNPDALRVAWPGSLFAETDDKTDDIRSVYRQIACALDFSPEQVAAQIAENVRNIFPSLSV